ncbi:MAG: hypothetical protein ACOYJB_07855 [Christensenellaceae bacterium]|jgi:hypothetical protein
MKKKATIILIIVMAICIMTSCSLFELRPVVEYETAEELVQATLEKTEGYKEGDPYVYREIDGYVFMLCGGVLHTTGKYYAEQGGYGGLMFSKLINIITLDEPIWNEKLYAVVITKDPDEGKYLASISGWEAIDGKSVEDPEFPLKIYDNEGNELEKLYDDEQLSCTWISVLEDIPEDYAVYAEYNGEPHLLYDAQTIMEKIGTAE